jgi:group I intron endonuclease
MIESGIYIIRNIINNHIYIGCTTNFYNREKQHFAMLKNNKHHSKHLQNSFNKYGVNNFKFEIIDRINKLNRLYYIENLYIQYYKPIYNSTGQNKYISVLDFNNTICPVCKSRLKINSKSIISFLKSDNSKKVCSNKFCYFEIDKIFEYEIQKLSYR